MYDYYLSGKPTQVLYQTVKILTGGAFGDGNYVANKSDGLVLDDGTYFEYAPLEIKLGKHQNDLEYTLDVTVLDLAEKYHDILQLDLTQKIKLIYAEYLNTNAPEMAVEFEVTQIVLQGSGAVFKCQMPQLNRSKTGVSYNLQDFKTMQGFV